MIDSYLFETTVAKTPRRHDYAVLTFLVLFPHPDPSDFPDRSLDVMSAVTPCHVPQTVTSDQNRIVMSTRGFYYCGFE